MENHASTLDPPIFKLDRNLKTGIRFKCFLHEHENTPDREVVGTFGYRENDVILTGDLVENVDKLAKLLGYEINQILDS